MKKSKVSEKRRIKTETNLALKGNNVDILWDTTHRVGTSETKVSVKCGSCGAIDVHVLTNIETGTYSCKSCRNNKYSLACKSLNLELIETTTINNATYLVTKCVLCGEEHTSYYGHILNSQFRCEGCVIDKYKHILSKRGCSFTKLEKCKGSRTLVHYTNSSGDSFVASNHAIVQDFFATTTDTHWNQHHSVYLIKLTTANNGFICKIGTANDPLKRANNLKLNGTYKVFTLETFDHRKQADSLESVLHRELSCFRLQSSAVSEYTGRFGSRRLSDGSRKKVKDGITEWFSSEVFNILSQRYNLE